MSTSLLYRTLGNSGVDYTGTEFFEGKVLFYAEVNTGFSAVVTASAGRLSSSVIWSERLG